MIMALLMGCQPPLFLTFADCKKADVVLLPHHLLVEGIIEEMYDELKTPRKVIIISPDHFNTGREQISKAQESEHGFTIHRDYVEKYFPKAKVEGWVIKTGTDTETLIEFTEQLAKEKALFIFSIDFSHYVPGKIAFAHDARTQDIIESRSIEEASTVEVDSPESIEVMLRLLEERGEKLLVIKSTNPSLDTNIETFENTTHKFGCSFDGEPAERRVYSTMDFSKSEDWYIGKTEEDRYLYGYDEIHFDQGGLDTVTIEYTGGQTKTIEVDYWPE